MHSWALRTFGIVASLAVWPAAMSFALEPETSLTRLARQSWSMENGLPQNSVPVLLQSRSGYLWAGTELGLARFDGVGFRVFDHATTPSFPDAEVRCMLDAGGDLWIGTGDGLLHWSKESQGNGQPVLVTTHDGLPNNSIQRLVETTDGKVWAWTDGGLARWSGTKFEAIHPESNLPAGDINSVAAGADGDLWVGSTKSVAIFHQDHWLAGLGGGAASSVDSGRRVPPTASLVAQAGSDVLIANSAGVSLEHGGLVTAIAGPAALPDDGVSFLVRLADGSVALASKSQLVLLRSVSSNSAAPSPSAVRFRVATQLPGSRIASIYPDREGTLWIGTNHGLARIVLNHASAQIEVLPGTDPLAADSVVAFLEDREGDLWVGTETAGLHLLRDARFRIVGTGDGLTSDATTAIVEDAHGSLWIGTRDAGLNRISNGAIPDGPAPSGLTSLSTANGLLSNVILSLAAAPNGDLWVGTPDGLSRMRGKEVSSFTSADGLPDDFIRSVLVLPDESVWVGTRRGLTHLDHGRFQSLTQADGLGSDLVGALARTADGDLWIATLNGLSRLHQGHLHNYTTADGLSSNVITALDVTADGIVWIGTQNDGLNLWDGERFSPVRDNAAGANRSLPGAIHAIQDDNRGHLWLASDSGLIRIDAASLLDCALRKSCDLKATHFTTVDGLRSRETSSNSHPTACRRSNGELWFTTPHGVVVADPLHFASMPDAPPVAIERVAVDDKELEAGQLAGIRAGALHFQFEYAGLSFASPQKVRYQYKLEGFDHAWTDAGARRTAYYTNIPPGTYRFRVRTMLGDFGASYANPQASEASLSFVLLPHFYQTLWFRALAVVLLVLLVLWFFRRRVLRVERELRAVMGERNRIAREIHDTLAQGYVGISLQLEILGELLRHKRIEAAAKHLDATKELVREGLDDARQSIWALRSQDAGEQTLPIRLRRLVEQAQSLDLTAYLDVHGAYRALTPEVEKELLRIAQEAIQNVKIHAAAGRLNVRLDYGERALTLAVADDGKGFPTAQGVAAGHYGLTGMRERAALIGAEIEIVSEPGAGTTVRLMVPAPEVRLRNRTLAEENMTQELSTHSKE